MPNRPYQLLLLAGVLTFSTSARAEVANPAAFCEFNLGAGDAFTPNEMTTVRAAAQSLKPFLAEWTPPVLKLDLGRIERTLARLHAGVDVDGEPFRLLYGAVGRFLLAAKGSEGRLRPLAEALRVSEGEVDAMVKFFAQMDVLAEFNRATPNFPFFLRAKASEILARDLGGAALRPAAEQTVAGIAKVLGRRARFARLAVEPGGGRLMLRSSVGTYVISISDHAIDRESIAHVEVAPSAQWGRQNDLNLTSAIEVGVDDAEIVSYLRTMIRGDAFFHPHLIPPFLEVYVQAARLSPVQRKVLQDLMVLDREAEARQVSGPVTLGHTMPTGEGKTVVNAGYVRAMMKERWNGRRPKIILTVENTNILRQTVESFVRDLGLDPKKIAMMFGDPTEHEFGTGANRFTVSGGSKVSAPLDFDLIVVTRSSLSERESSLNHWIDQENAKDPGERRPFLVIGDEGHHFGAEDGQYQRILKLLRAKLRIEDRILVVSATFANPNRNIIVDDLGGNIVASHLNAEELAQLRRGENLDYLSLTQFLRATIEGYVNPIDDESFTLADDPATAEALRKRLSRKEVADEELYGILGKMMLKLRRTGIMDRWIFFEVRQERAEDGASLLRKIFGQSAVRYMHSGIPAAEQKDAMEWFMDKGEFRGTRFQHKIMETVSQMIEGTDVRGANGIAILRNLVYDRVAQQILGRGARLEPFKVSVRLADVSGRVLEYLQRAGALWTRARLGGGGRREPREQGALEPLEPAASLAPVALRPTTISIEHSLRRERGNLVSMMNVDPTARIAGGWSSLAYAPGARTASTTVDLKTRMTEWFERFPVSTRARAKALFGGLAWPAMAIDLASPNVSQTKTIQAGLEVFVRMFNATPEVERFGLAPLTTADVSTRGGLDRLFAYLDPEYAFEARGGVAPAPSLAEGMKLYASIRAGELFARGTPKTFTTKIQSATARESLAMILELAKDRGYLQQPAPRALLARAGKITSEAQASYLLGRLLEALLTPAGLAKLGGWDLGPAFGLPPNPRVRAPSLALFWTAIGRLDAGVGR